MQLEAALQAVLLAVLLAGPPGATGRLLSGECARWGGSWFPGALGCGAHCTPLRLTVFGATVPLLWRSRRVGGGVTASPH